MINMVVKNLKLTKLPICKCGLPCDIKCKDNSYLYFRCCKKNMWNDLEELFNLKKKPCDFYKEFNDVVTINALGDIEEIYKTIEANFS